MKSIIDQNNSKQYYKIFKYQHPKYYNDIISKTLFLNKVSFSEKLFCFINKITSPMLCDNINCNEKTKFINFKSGYNDYFLNSAP